MNHKHFVWVRILLGNKIGMKHLTLFATFYQFPLPNVHVAVSAPAFVNAISHLVFLFSYLLDDIHYEFSLFVSALTATGLTSDF